MTQRIVALSLCLSASGCYYSECPNMAAYPMDNDPGYVHVTVAPPPVKEETAIPAKPTAGSMWVGGHWDWRGEWVWVRGHWEDPRPGYVWTQPVATAHPNGGYRYHPGYWRPHAAPQPTVYQQPGVIEVNVRGSAGGSVGTTQAVPVQQPQAGATVQAVPTQPRVTATVQAVPAQPRATATVQAVPAQPRATATVQATPAQPRATATVQATPAQPATASGRAQPAVPATPARPATPATHAQPAVAATPARPATHAAHAQPAIAATPARPATPAVHAQPAIAATPARPATPAGRAQPAIAATPARPATSSGRAQPTISATPAIAATPAVGSASAHGRGATNAPQAQLQCQLNTSRAPAGGLITLTGNDFGSSPLVRIGGAVAPIVNRSRNQLRVQVPAQSAGGAVTLSAGGQESRCGSVTILR